MKMCTKLFIITLSVIMWSTVTLGSGTVDQKLFDTVQHPALARLVKMRCTRRFSPGTCVENVEPVWTFVFLQQNCTERLGCPNSYRTNRFQSYRMCIKRCRPLVDMFLKLVEFEEKMAMMNETLDEAWDRNDTDERHLREGIKDEIIAASPKETSSINLADLSPDLDDEEEYEEREQDSRFIVYKDSNVNEDIMLPDVDYVPGEIRSDVDLTHW